MYSKWKARSCVHVIRPSWNRHFGGRKDFFFGGEGGYEYLSEDEVVLLFYWTGNEPLCLKTSKLFVSVLAVNNYVITSGFFYGVALWPWFGVTRLNVLSKTSKHERLFLCSGYTAALP